MTEGVIIILVVTCVAVSISSAIYSSTNSNYHLKVPALLMTRAIQHHHYRVIPIINYSYFRPASCCTERDGHVIEKALLMAADHSHGNGERNYEQCSEITTIWKRNLAVQSQEC